MAAKGSYSESLNWECPVCLLVPPNHVFQISCGHSLCSTCLSKVKICPECRMEIGGQKQRNFLAEKLLDSLKLKCHWDRCTKEFSRGDISGHEEQCPHNPNAIKLCSFMSHNCNFQFTIESLQDVLKAQQVIEHMNLHHNFDGKRVILGERVKSTIYLDHFLVSPDSNSALKYQHGNKFIRKTFSLDHNNKKHLFMQLLRIYANSAGEEVMSIMFVQLTPDFGLEAASFKFKLAITTQPGADEILELGPDCAATTTWTVKPKKITDFIEDCERPAAHQPPVPFSLRMSTLETNYADVFGTFCFEFYITTGMLYWNGQDWV